MSDLRECKEYQEHTIQKIRNFVEETTSKGGMTTGRMSMPLMIPQAEYILSLFDRVKELEKSKENAQQYAKELVEERVKLQQQNERLMNLFNWIVERGEDLGTIDKQLQFKEKLEAFKQ